MALTYDDLNSTTQSDLDKVLVETCYDTSPFYKKLKSMDKIIDGGIDFQWTIRYKHLDLAKAVDPNTKLVYERVQTRTKAKDDYKYYIVPALVTWEERVKNSGKHAIIDLQADKAEEMKQDLIDLLTTDLYTANGNGNGLTPLATIVDSADTYGGIAVADAAAWASTEVTSSEETVLSIYGSAYSLTKIRNDATFGGKGPTFHLTTKELRDKFESKLEPKQRYESKDKSASLGFTDVYFYGDPVIGDEYCPAGYWYGLDMDQFKLVVHPKFNFKTTPWGEQSQVGFPNALARSISWVGNLQCKERRTSFKYSGLDYTK